MLYDPATGHHLKPWLIRTLEPICDAEPGALADYILALLKHNVSEPEMRKELSTQLEEFLEKECSSFVDTLFTVLRTKTYLPYASESGPPKPVDNGIPIPFDLLTPPPADTGSDRSRKRSIEADERDGRPPAKGARIHSEGQFSRYGNGGRADGQWEGRGEAREQGYTNGGMQGFNMHMMAGMGHRRPQPYQPPDQKRGICRDYHNNGYCARGIMCKYSHGEDAMVPGQLYPLSGIPFLPMFPGGMPFGPPGGYDPNDSRIDMRPRHQRVPILARTQQEEGGTVHASGELPVIQDLTPASHQKTSAASVTDSETQSHNAPSVGFDQSQITQPPQDAFHDSQVPGMTSMPPVDYIPMQPQMDIGMVDGSSSGYRGGRGRGGRGRGTFNGEVHNFRPGRRGDKTLVVEKIPEDKLSLEHVNNWFKRFGTVTNVAIDQIGSKALVSFSSHDEAHAAWKSEDAVFNNRFVKLFWHRPMDGQGQVGARMLAASAPVVANITARQNTTLPPSNASPSPAIVSTKTSSATSALAAKQQQLEQQIAEQKSLMAALQSATPEEKKDIMIKLRKLGEQMKATSPPPPGSSTQKPTSTTDDKAHKERERLDKDLEVHSTSVPSQPPAVPKEKQETAEELKTKLEKLKAEAASLGLNTETSPGDWHSGAPSYRGGYRGRGRGGRGYYRGTPRGGAPRFNMTLDNRPRKLLLKGAKNEQLQVVKEWYEATGHLESVESHDNGDIVVSFKTRVGAEQGLAKGQNISGIGHVQLSWFNRKSSAATSTSASARKVVAESPTVAFRASETQDGRSRTPEPDAEEEMVARGWGGEDDGDGMGML